MIDNLTVERALALLEGFDLEEAVFKALLEKYEPSTEARILRRIYYDVLEYELAVGVLDTDAFTRLFEALDETTVGRDTQREQAILVQNKTRENERMAMFRGVMNMLDKNFK